MNRRSFLARIGLAAAAVPLAVTVREPADAVPLTKSIANVIPVSESQVNDVVIHIDPFRPADKRHQMAMVDGIAYAKERFGPNTGIRLRNP
jgi:hypothetical protein